jgi:hypothetical protein
MNENKHEGENEVEEEAKERRMSCTLEEMASISSPCCLPPPSRLHIKAIGCPIKSNSTAGINKPKASPSTPEVNKEASDLVIEGLIWHFNNISS